MGMQTDHWHLRAHTTLYPKGSQGHRNLQGNAEDILQKESHRAREGQDRRQPKHPPTHHILPISRHPKRICAMCIRKEESKRRPERPLTDAPLLNLRPLRTTQGARDVTKTEEKRARRTQPLRERQETMPSTPPENTPLPIPIEAKGQDARPPPQARRRTATGGTGSATQRFTGLQGIGCNTDK